MAYILRIWTEEVGVLDENQDEFRVGRWTAHLEQICMRLHDEAELYVYESSGTECRTHVTTLLDIMKIVLTSQQTDHMEYAKKIWNKRGKH